MPTINRQKTWIPGDVLTSGDLNSEFNNILNLVNGVLDSDNIGTLQTLNFVNTTATGTLVINSSGGGGAWKVVS